MTLTVNARSEKIVDSESQESPREGKKRGSRVAAAARGARNAAATTKRVAVSAVKNVQSDEDLNEATDRRGQTALNKVARGTAKRTGKFAVKATGTTGKLAIKLAAKGTGVAVKGTAAGVSKYARSRSIAAQQRTAAAKTAKAAASTAVTASKEAMVIARAAAATTRIIQAVASVISAVVASTPMIAIIAAIVAVLVSLLALISWFLPTTTASESTYAQGNLFVVGAPPGPWGGFENGRIPDSALALIPWAPGHSLRPDALKALSALSAEYKKEFGQNISVTDSYRSFAGQLSTRDSWCLRGSCHMAAVPGTSNHGWGLAVDLGGGINRFGTKEHQWMQDNAGRFGWVHPDWAKPGGGQEEAWHWEFWGWSGTELEGEPQGEVQVYADAKMEAVFGVMPDHKAQFSCLQTLWTNESGWDHTADNPTSSAYGIPQALPGSKMASAGDDWKTNPRTQVDWGLTYIKDRYGSPCEAWAFWQSKDPHWY